MKTNYLGYLSALFLSVCGSLILSATSYAHSADCYAQDIYTGGSDNRYQLSFTCNNLPQATEGQQPDSFRWLYTGDPGNNREVFYDGFNFASVEGGIFTYTFPNEQLYTEDITMSWNVCRYTGNGNPQEETGDCEAVTPLNFTYTPPPPPDSDGDGVSDDQENSDGTNPGDSCDFNGADTTDSDGDGYIDCVEDREGTSKYNSEDYPGKITNYVEPRLGQRVGVYIMLFLGAGIVILFYKMYVPKGRR